MGLKYPTSLKLKKHKIWNNVLYKYNFSDLLKIKKEYKNIENFIKNYFQYTLVSKPVIFHGNKSLKIKIYYYIKTASFISPVFHTDYNLIRLENILKQIYKKPVEIQLIKLNHSHFKFYFYLESVSHSWID